ncbi:hypothetical protein ACIQXV_16510 [Neobacillus sp. NPDC097160]
MAWDMEAILSIMGMAAFMAVILSTTILDMEVILSTIIMDSNNVVDVN